MVRQNNIDVWISTHNSVPCIAPGPDECQVIADWLSPLNFKVTQRDIFKQRTEGTGNWLLDSPEFTAWLAGVSKTLWCFGMREILSPNSHSHIHLC